MSFCIAWKYEDSGGSRGHLIVDSRVTALARHRKIAMGLRYSRCPCHSVVWWMVNIVSVEVMNSSDEIPRRGPTKSETACRLSLTSADNFNLVFLGSAL